MSKLARTRSGANDRTGFIEAPLTGAAQRPAKAMYPPTAIAPLVPMFRAPDAVPKIVFTNPAVSTASSMSAFALSYIARRHRRAECSNCTEHGPEKERRRDTTAYLGQNVARYAAPREITT